MLQNVTQGEAAPAACCTTEADALSAAGWAGVNMGAERRGRGGGKRFRPTAVLPYVCMDVRSMVTFMTF